MSSGLQGCRARSGGGSGQAAQDGSRQGWRRRTTDRCLGAPAPSLRPAPRPRPTPRWQLLWPPRSNSIRVVPDFPKPGIQFQDVTTILLNPEAFASAIDLLHERYKDMGIDVVAGASGLACQLSVVH